MRVRPSAGDDAPSARRGDAYVAISTRRWAWQRFDGNEPGTSERLFVVSRFEERHLMDINRVFDSLARPDQMMHVEKARIPLSVTSNHSGDGHSGVARVGHLDRGVIRSSVSADPS